MQHRTPHVAADPADQESYDALCFYSLEHGGGQFIHQHVVDAHAAQVATAEDKPIRLAFALAGLCLHLEHGFDGRRVQLAHTAMARQPRAWPRFELPTTRGGLTAADLVAVDPGPARDEAIHDWCASVWAAHVRNHELVRDWLAGFELAPGARRRSAG